MPKLKKPPRPVPLNPYMQYAVSVIKRHVRLQHYPHNNYYARPGIKIVNGHSVGQHEWIPFVHIFELMQLNMVKATLHGVNLTCPKEVGLNHEAYDFSTPDPTIRGRFRTERKPSF